MGMLERRLDTSSQLVVKPLSNGRFFVLHAPLPYEKLWPLGILSAGRERSYHLGSSHVRLAVTYGYNSFAKPFLPH